MRKVPRFTLKQHDPSLFRGTYKTCICAMYIRMSNIWGPNASPPLFAHRLTCIPYPPEAWNPA